LMITVAIIAILASVAVPSYREYVIRSNFPNATSNLATAAVKMEQWFQDNRTYVGAPACASGGITGKGFSFSCSNVTGSTYLITATGTGSLSWVGFTVDQAGGKTTVINTGAPSGWSAASPNNCWIIRKGGQC